MKLKVLIILIGYLSGCVAMDDENYSTPTKKLKRTCMDNSKFLNEFYELKNKFRKSLEDLDYSLAKILLQDIEKISWQPSLILASPKIKHSIEKFLKSNEVEQFKKDYQEYKSKLKEELNHILVGQDKQSNQILPKDVTKIVNEYLCVD